MKRDDGNKVVVIPKAGNSVEAIPIADEIPVLLSVWAYDTSSPVTKKWFGKEIVFVVTLTTSDVDPSYGFLNIGSPLCSRANFVLIADSVPS